MMEEKARWIAVTRAVSPKMAECELSYVPRTDIDVERAGVQHRRYAEMLVTLGCRVVSAPAETGLADSVFVEDTAVVLDEVAVIMRPGAESRRAETSSMASTLEAFRDLAFIHAPGTLDGGDILRLGRTLLVGLSSRSNREGIDQLDSIGGRFGYRVQGVAVRGCLHLKSAVTQVAPDTLLLNPRRVDESDFKGMRLVQVDPEEPHAANALLLGETVVYSTSWERTGRRLEARGIALERVEVSELEKAEGGVTCCSLVFAPLGVGTC